MRKLLRHKQKNVQLHDAKCRSLQHPSYDPPGAPCTGMDAQHDTWVNGANFCINLIIKLTVSHFIISSAKFVFKIFRFQVCFDRLSKG